MRLLSRQSLRWRLTLQAGFVLLLAVFVFAVGLLLFTLHEDREDIDASLLRETKAIEHILATAPRKDAMVLLKTLLASEPGRRMAEIRHRNGKIALLSTHSNLPILLDLQRPAPIEPVFETKIINGRALRIVYFHRDDYLLAVAEQPESIKEILQDAFLLYIGLSVILLGFIIWGGASLASRALSPIVELADATKRITALDTTQRLPTGQADDEINRLSQVLNDMLDRLHANLGLVRRFTADAAHEIKTPLAIVQGHLEGALSDQSGTHELSPKQEEAILTTLREVGRLNRLVEGLLLLSRSDAGRLDLQLAPLDWSALTGELLHDAEILCAPLNLQLEADIAPDLLVLADENHLRQVLLNLLDNACKYNRPDGMVRITLTSAADAVRFEIGNTGPAIPSEAIPLLFERFQRGDTSRSREHTDSIGLGLSICREIVLAHRGRIELSESRPDWTCLAVTLFKAGE